MTAAGAVADPAEGTADTLTFLRRIWPANGLYVVARLVGKSFEHQVCDTIEGAAAYVQQFDAQGVPTYHGCAVLRERWVDELQASGKIKRKVRTQKNIRAAKALWTELDVDAADCRKFESREAALDALVTFCQSTGVPVPTIISSGGGLHLYWELSAEVSPGMWQQAANRLKALFAATGFKASRERTADIASVLRPVGSWNRKDSINPRAVECIHEAAPTVYAVLRESIEAALKKHGVKPPEGVRKVESSTEALNQQFAVQREFPPCSGVKVAERCKQLGAMRDTKGNISEPHWYAGIQLLCHSIEGDELIHAWSNGHGEYSVEETNRKIAQVREQSLGPTLCTTFEDRNPGGCDGCPSKGQISTPARLGAQIAPRPLPDVIDEGSRNAVLIRIALVMKANGMETATIGDVLRTENSRRCRPPLADCEVDAIAERACGYDGSALPLTEVGNADRFVLLFGRLVRYCHDFRKWLIWDGRRWCFDETGQIIELAKVIPVALQLEAARTQGQEIGKHIGRHALASGQQKRILAMLDLAKSRPPVAITSGFLDQRPMLLAVRNGVVDLASGGLRAPHPDDLLTKQAGTDYTPHADCFEWLEFLERIMGGDQSLISFLQRAIGYSLTGKTSEQCLFFLHGSGANGKSTLLNVVEALLGDYATQCQAESLMIKGTSGAANNDIARLRGARFVASNEIEDGSRLAESLVKQLTGQDIVTTRFLYAEHFQYRPEFKLWIAGNHKPIIRGDDYAIWRRIRLIPFGVSIPPDQQDHELSTRLLMELPGILNWALKGCLEQQRSGLKPPSKVVIAVDDYRAEMDVIQNWLDDCCTQTGTAKTKASNLYASYRTWAVLNGHHPLSSPKFSLKLAGRGFQKEKSREANFYIGLTLRGLDPAQTLMPMGDPRGGCGGLGASFGNFPSSVA